MDSTQHSSVLWLLPPQPVSKEESFLDESFANKENDGPKSKSAGRPRRRTIDAAKKEAIVLNEALKDLAIGPEYRGESEKRFTRLQKRRMTVDDPVLQPKYAENKEKRTKIPAPSKEVRQQPKVAMPPPPAPKKPRVQKQRSRSKSQNAAPDAEAARDAPPAAEEAPRSALARLDSPAALTFSQLMNLCNPVSQGVQEPIRSPPFYVCFFPAMASFWPCVEGITFCKVAQGTGLIRLEGNRARQFAFTEDQTFNLVVIAGRMRVTVRSSQSSNDGAWEVINMSLLSYVCLKPKVAYKLANVHQEEAICFFWRETSASSALKNL